MIQLIVYGLIVAILVGGAVAVRNSIEDKGIAKQKAIDAPIIEAAKKAADTAKAANDGLAAERVSLLADRQACSDKVAELAKSTDAKIAAASRARLTAETKASSLETDAALFKTKAGKPETMGATCETTLSAVVDPLRELAARRLRDHGSADAGHDGSGAGSAPGQDSGAGAVRIGP